MKLLSLFIGALFVFKCDMHAQTDIFGGNILTTTWTQSGSPYNIFADISIPSGSTLTIEPGVEVLFSDIDFNGSGNSVTLVEFVIMGGGSLIVSGTADDSIKFLLQSVPLNDEIWYGIEAEQNSQLHINYAHIQNTRTALKIGEVTPSSIKNCTIKEFTDLGIEVNGSEGTQLTLNNVHVIRIN